MVQRRECVVGVAFAIAVRGCVVMRKRYADAVGLMSVGVGSRKSGKFRGGGGVWSVAGDTMRPLICRAHSSGEAGCALEWRLALVEVFVVVVRM